MLKKFKIGDQVRLTDTAAWWFIDNDREIFSVDGKFLPKHAEELLALIQSVNGSRDPLVGKVIGYGSEYTDNGTVRVSLRNWYGKFEAYIEHGNLIRLTSKQRREKSRK